MKRCIFWAVRWVLPATFLGALGWLLYLVLPPRVPRWALDGEVAYHDMSADGRWLVYWLSNKKLEEHTFHVANTHSGRIHVKLPVTATANVARAPDGQRLALVVKEGSLRL